MLPPDDRLTKQSELNDAYGPVPTTQEVVRDALAAYASRDLEGFFAPIADDVVYTLYLDEEVVPFAGQAHGKIELRARIEAMHAVFEYVLWRPLHVRTLGETATNQIEFILKHRATGESVSGRCRFVTQVVNGKVVRIQEHHDAERIQAFMRLIGGVG